MKKITLLLLLTLLSLHFTAQEKEGTKQSKYPENVEKNMNLN